MALIGLWLRLVTRSSDWNTQLRLQQPAESLLSENTLMVASQSAVTTVWPEVERAETAVRLTDWERRHTPLCRCHTSSLPPSVAVMAEQWPPSSSSLVIPLYV